jgi:hypothetical protein
MPAADLIFRHATQEIGLRSGGRKSSDLHLSRPTRTTCMRVRVCKCVLWGQLDGRSAYMYHNSRHG